MGCFVISQTATGVRFLLRSDAGQTLAISKNYASLDTCKKGIRSLITILPGAPVVNLTAGERGPNPKCEIDGEEGAYVYRYKSSNGKVVIESRPVQTEKAALRAIAMLKEAVAEPKMMFWQKEGYVPLKLGLPTGDKKPSSVANAPTRGAKKQEVNRPVTLPGDFLIPAESVPGWEDGTSAEPTPVRTVKASGQEHAKPEAPAKVAEQATAKQEAPAAKVAEPAPVKQETPVAPKPVAKAAPTPETVKKVPEKPEKEEKKKHPFFGIFGKIHKLR